MATPKIAEIGTFALFLQHRKRLTWCACLLFFSFLFNWVFSLNFSSACQVLLLGMKTEQIRNVCGCNARRRAGGRGEGMAGGGGGGAEQA